MLVFHFCLASGLRCAEMPPGGRLRRQFASAARCAHRRWSAFPQNEQSVEWSIMYMMLI